MTTAYDYAFTAIDGSALPMTTFRDKVVLVVNVASKCGLTPQYDGLEQLYKDYRDQGLVVLGVPSNQFMGQEPGTNEEIASFCASTYAVDFPLFQKIVVTGPEKHPLYQALTTARPQTDGGDSAMRTRLEGFGIATGGPGEVLWNFEKFLVGRDGQVKARFAPDTAPDDPRLVAALDAALAAN